MLIFTHLAGANPTRRTTHSEFQPGTPTLADDNTSWVYVGPASEDIPIGGVDLDSNFAPSVEATTGLYDATAAFAEGEYGWVVKATSPL